MSMYQPKKDLYDLLSTLEGVSVFQNRPERIEDFPCITFQVADNSVTTDLNREISYQEMLFDLNLWAKTSAENSSLLTTLEEELRSNSYLLVSSADVNDPDGYSHIVARFKFIN